MPDPRLDSNRSKTSPVQERRVASRQKSYSEAWADPGGMEPAIPCKVIDISITGAKLGCNPGVNLPECFTLHFGHSKYAAQVVWRRPNQHQIGVEFQQATIGPRESGQIPPPR